MAQLQHQRFPGSFLLIAALLSIPTILYGFVRAAEHADHCMEVSMQTKADTTTPTKDTVKCEKH